MTKTMHGKVHGKTIELDEDLGSVRARGLAARESRDQRRIIMKHEIRLRVLREATPEEKERHQRIREEIQHELPELKQWHEMPRRNIKNA